MAAAAGAIFQGLVRIATPPASNIKNFITLYSIPFSDNIALS
jgi:hypothetical protein